MGSDTRHEAIEAAAKALDPFLLLGSRSRAGAIFQRARAAYDAARSGEREDDREWTLWLCPECGWSSSTHVPRGLCCSTKPHENYTMDSFTVVPKSELERVRAARSGEAEGEAYPEPWKTAVIHLNPDTGEMHSDGDHSVRAILEWMSRASTGRLFDNPKRKEQFVGAMTRASRALAPSPKLASASKQDLSAPSPDDPPRPSDSEHDEISEPLDRSPIGRTVTHKQIEQARLRGSLYGEVAGSDD